MRDVTPTPSMNAPTSVEMVRCAAAQLTLPLTDDTVQHVAIQWARLQTMAAALAQEPLGPADEPAPVFTP